MAWSMLGSWTCALSNRSVFSRCFVATKPRHRNAPELPAPLNAKTCAGPTAVRADPRKGQPWNR